MHQTTVRFGPDLWEALERECDILGVSVAQYLREAALTRLVYAAGRRGDDEFELALDLATGVRDEAVAERTEPAERPSREWTAREAQARAHEEQSQSAALAAQGQLARARARKLRERAHELR